MPRSHHHPDGDFIQWQIPHDPARRIHHTDLLIFSMLDRPERLTPAEVKRLEKLYCESQTPDGLNRPERKELIRLWHAKFRDVRMPTHKQARKLSHKLLLTTREV